MWRREWEGEPDEEEKIKEEMATVGKMEVVAERKAELVIKNKKNTTERKERWAQTLLLRHERSKIKRKTKQKETKQENKN